MVNLLNIFRTFLLIKRNKLGLKIFKVYWSLEKKEEYIENCYSFE